MIRMKLLLSLLFLAPLMGLSQGVHFESGSSWQQILAKAKIENKYIFLDCYASWCGPCKMMDRDVYSKDSVGAVMNEKFVSVKVQMDTSKKDDDSIKAWYADAHRLMTTYKIGAFPSFLFFSPDGKIVHRDLAFKTPEAFLKLAADAQDPQKQYCLLLEKYQSGWKDYTAIPEMAKHAFRLGDLEAAEMLANEFIKGYLDKKKSSDLLLGYNLNFLKSFNQFLSSNDACFQSLLRHQALADSIEHDRLFSIQIIDAVIVKEEIAPAEKLAKENNKEPEWNRIKANISHKYPEDLADFNIIDSRVKWCKGDNDWKNFTKYLVIEIQKYSGRCIPDGFWGGVILNNNAWDIFEHSSNKEELEKAVAWSDKAIKLETNHDGSVLDTKANLLYKLGQRDEAI